MCKHLLYKKRDYISFFSYWFLIIDKNQDAGVEIIKNQMVNATTSAIHTSDRILVIKMDDSRTSIELFQGEPFMKPRYPRICKNFLGEMKPKMK